MSLHRYFPDLEDDAATPSLATRHRCYVSVFDHWLSEAEAGRSPTMYYGLAVKTGSLATYAQGERRFLDFYLALASQGVLCRQDDTVRELAGDEPEFERILIDSLRENRLMDVYFIRDRVRAIGGFDRTDLLILENAADLFLIRTYAAQAGLHILDA